MRKILLSVLAVTVLLGATSFGLAQSEMKPLVTVSVAGYDKLKADVGVIGNLIGNPKLADGLEMMLQMMTQGKGLAGLDKKQPWGVVLFSAGGPIDPSSRTVPLLDQIGPTYGFVPVADLKQLMEVAKSNPKLAALITLENDVYQIGVASPGNPPLYVQQKGKWAVIVRNSKDLANAPADPLKLLGDLPANYGLAVRLSVKNIPDSLRQMLLGSLQSLTMLQPPGTGAGGVMGLKQGIEQLTELVNDLDEVLLGWNVDASTSRTYVDFTMTAKSGTKLADQFAQVKPGKTKFAGLKMPEAAVTVSKTVTLTDADVAQAKEMLTGLHKTFTAQLENQDLSEDQVKLAKELADDVLDVLQKTIESKKNDAGLALLLEPGAASVVFGAQVAEGDKLDGVLKKLVDADPEATKQIKLNADKHEGIRFHTMSVPTPSPQLTPLVGDTLEIVVGIANDRLLVAIGHDAIKTLKKVIDQSKAGADKEVPPVEIKLAFGKIAKFATEMAKDNAPPDAQVKLSTLTSALEKAGDKDHVIITASPIPQGVRVRVEMEEGLVKAFASIAQTFAQMRMGPPGAMPPGPPVMPPPAK